MRAPTYSLTDFVRFCAHLRTESGRPLRVQPFQRRLLAPYFAGTRETVIVLPTGNGKTTLLGALAVYHMLRVPNAMVLIVAAAQEQAATLFRQASTLVRDSAYAELLDVKHGTYRIFHQAPSLRGRSSPSARRPGEIRVIASEVGRQEGAIPTLVLVDELHAHRDMQMYEMLRDKLWKRAGEAGCGRMITISTAGFSFSSPLFALRERVQALPTYRLEGVEHRASGPGFEWFEYALSPEDDRDDLRAVARVNPAPWITLKTLRARRASVTLSPGEWARSACNVWTAGEDPAILPQEWDRLRADIGQIRDGDEVVLVPSVGHIAALGMALERDGGIVAVRAEVLEPREGHSILADTEEAIAQACSRWAVRAVYHPLGPFIRSADLLAARGIPMVQAPQSPAALSAASATFDRLRRSGELIHDGDPTLRRHVLAAQIHTTEQGERYLISDRSRALVAVVMAAHYATAAPPTPTIVIPSFG